MTKKVILSVVVVFVAWAVMDFIVHGLILRSSYEATAYLWRPKDEMKMGLMYLTILVSAAVFVYIYARLIGPKAISTGVKYGLLFGLGAGISMGLGSYSVMPIPYDMALVWFLGSLAQGAAGGLLAGLIIRN